MFLKSTIFTNIEFGNPESSEIHNSGNQEFSEVWNCGKFGIQEIGNVEFQKSGILYFWIDGSSLVSH